MAVIIRKSAIHGRGVFAKRAFSKGDTVLVWHPEPLSPKQLEALPLSEQVYLLKIRDNWYLMQPPERYVNHSCNANTIAGGSRDVAVRDIEQGEEITSDYSAIVSRDSFVCRCGSMNCRGIIGQAEGGQV